MRRVALKSPTLHSLQNSKIWRKKNLKFENSIRYGAATWQSHQCSRLKSYHCQGVTTAQDSCLTTVEDSPLLKTQVLPLSRSHHCSRLMSYNCQGVTIAQDSCLTTVKESPLLKTQVLPLSRSHNCGKTRMAWLPDGEKVSTISLLVLAQLANVTDGRTDGRTDRHRVTAIAALCIASHGKNDLWKLASGVGTYLSGTARAVPLLKGVTIAQDSCLTTVKESQLLKTQVLPLSRSHHCSSRRRNQRQPQVTTTSMWNS